MFEHSIILYRIEGYIFNFSDVEGGRKRGRVMEEKREGRREGG